MTQLWHGAFKEGTSLEGQHADRSVGLAWGIALLRIVVGIVFVMHGRQLPLPGPSQAVPSKFPGWFTILTFT
jgi:uncharacterized membrane protein YphA (DoxX/SURF4 family)